MEAFGKLLLDLYRMAQEVPATEFQERAIEEIREVIPFDSAVWGTGVMDEQHGATPHTLYVYRQPPEMMESWGRVRQHDALAFEAFHNLGKTIKSGRLDPLWLPRYHPEMLEHIERFHMEYSLSTVVVEPVLQLLTALSFYRADINRPFTEEERLFKQNLMPHLIEALNINRLHFMYFARKGNVQSNRARAICDKMAVLYNADGNFAKLMLAEWPEWKGPKLPPDMQDAISIGQRRYVGRNSVVGFEPFNDMLLITAREKSVVDELTPRELDVAKCLGEGMEYREIASALSIQPVTVRNYIQDIYAKLGVNNKVEVARLMFEDES